jgi:hypothetical protein
MSIYSTIIDFSKDFIILNVVYSSHFVYLSKYLVIFDQV